MTDDERWCTGRGANPMASHSVGWRTPWAARHGPAAQVGAVETEGGAELLKCCNIFKREL